MNTTNVILAKNTPKLFSAAWIHLNQQTTGITNGIKRVTYLFLQIRFGHSLSGIITQTEKTKAHGQHTTQQLPSPSSQAAMVYSVFAVMVRHTNLL